MPNESLVGQTGRIISLDGDPILRNLLITQCYHDLSSALSQVLSPTDANWCTFATWASKTAGRFIRKEEAPKPFRELLASSVALRGSAQRLRAAIGGVLSGIVVGPEDVLDLADRIIDDVSEQITAGNLKVFSELGPIFAELVDAYDAPGRPSQQRVAALLAKLRPGPSRSGGQSLLHSALEHFVEASAESNPTRKAQLLLLANAQTGLHEQIRLQPYIARSLDAPVADLFEEVWNDRAKKANGGANGASILHRLHAAFERLAHPIVAETERIWQVFSTRELMTLMVPPDQLLRLGADLPPPPPPGTPLFPRELDQLEIRELVQLADQYGAFTPADVAALDWTRLPDRMRYIIALFRSRQQDQPLLGPPFTPAQHQSLLEDRVPPGPL